MPDALEQPPAAVTHDMDFGPRGAALPHRPSTPLALHALAAAADGLFRLKLAKASGEDLGWLGWDSDHWAVCVKDPSHALSLGRYVENGKTYYHVGPSVNRAWWLSFSEIGADNGRVGFYGWSGATAWTRQGARLKSEDGKSLAFSGAHDDSVRIDHQANPIDVAEDSPYATSIQHLFVLMLENRSFDHMLGFSGISGVDASTGQQRRINGLTGNEVNASGGQPYPVKHPADWQMSHDPGHEFVNVLRQLCGHGAHYPPGGAYPPVDNIFAADYAGVGPDPGEVMKCYDRGQIPALVTLAEEFAVCDNWFSSMPGPTWPNRLFAVAASAGGLDITPTTQQIAAWSANPAGGFQFDNGSLFDKAGLTSQVCVHDRVSNNCGALAGVSHLDLWRFSDFKENVAQGHVPQFTFIEPHYGRIVDNSYVGGNSQHPIDDVRSGDQLIADVYNAIRNSPVWPRSMLIVTWDEHGGFYDHVAPGPAPAPGDRTVMPDVNKTGFDFTHYGVRVPAVVVSPLIKKGVIDGRLYDHASIPATVAKLFNLTPLTRRDKAANSLDALLTLPAPRPDCPPSIGSSAPHLLAAAFPAAREMVLPPEVREAKRQEPLDQGNLVGFVYSAMRLHLELSPPPEHPAIRARVAGLKTVADAQDYIDDVQRLLQVRAPESLAAPRVRPVGPAPQ